MQIFANGKRRFHSFTELYVIRSKKKVSGARQVKLYVKVIKNP